MTESPLTTPVVFLLGPVPVTLPVVATWGLMAVMVLGSALATRRLRVERPGPVQTVLELVVETLRRQIAETMQTDATPSCRCWARCSFIWRSPTCRGWCRA